MSRRSIIVHFHLFKNAGTSVETILQRHFGDRFTRYEHGGAAETFPASVLIPYLEANRHIQAISSHTICFPPPSRRDWSVLPMVFLRHPLDRILSMYNYERGQEAQNPGAILAKAHDLAGYISARLENPGEHSLRNYQTWMLAREEYRSKSPAADQETLLEYAANALDALPVIGVVDQFEESIRQFDAWLAPHFPRLNLKPEHLNRSASAPSNMQERIQLTRDAVGESLFQRLASENAMDLELYRLGCEKLLSRA